jgi:acyl transferase domain-containing protein/surfactin synthase thioesterase subunit
MSTEALDAGIAIVGMACRLPGADNPRELWQNLLGGVESIHFFSDDELLAAGVPPTLLARPDYVKAAPMIRAMDRFDAPFFGCSPKEATLMDPQQRLFLEVAWEAFENAGHDPEVEEEVVGVFAGAGGMVTNYMVAHSGDPAFPGQTGGLAHISNDKDFLSTRVSYKLNLTGPSLTVQTACSTSLVAVHLACQSLRTGECDMALAGASTIRVPHQRGYLAPRGSIYSADGRCRAFDAHGTGTIFGSGVVAVLLRPLPEALAAGDFIHAVIRGTAINNDGGNKVSYTAPSVLGEARAMLEALSVAEVPPDTVGYVECHATGTAVGDPLEIQALARAFRTQTRREGFCAVGSLKANIGHPEQSAGIAGLIKTALVLREGKIPPTPIETLNPDIPFAGSPFYLNTEVIPWARNGHPRRAAVNSLGMGGTNAFAVLEEAPTPPPRPANRRSIHLLCLSAKSESALRARCGQLRDVLGAEAPPDLGDLCHTANRSRSRFRHRFTALGGVTDLRQQLAAYAAGGAAPGAESHGAEAGKLAFLFSGQGFQSPRMGAALYRTQPTFRAALERCDEGLREWLDPGLLAVLFASEEALAARIHETAYAQPALFAVEYALAALWRSWGIVPDAVLGHSVGEITAACVAGVFDLADALRLVAQRGALMQSLPEGGAMLAVLSDGETVQEALAAAGPEGGAEISIAAFNSPRNTVLSGPAEALEACARTLAEGGLESRPLKVSRAFHSALMEPILDALEAVAEEIPAGAPRLPLLSNLTGQPLTEAPSPRYWRDHARHGVRFADSLETLAREGYSTFLEVGPGKGLLSLGRQCLPGTGVWASSLDRHEDDWASLLNGVRHLYLAGFDPHWRHLDEGQGCRRVPLPTYPFERQRYWLASTPARADLAVSPGESPTEASTEQTVELESLGEAPLAEHRIHGAIVLPTSFILTAALDVARQRFGAAVEVADFSYHRALVLSPQGVPRIDLTVGGDGTFRLLAEHPSEGGRQQHATGSLRAAPAAATPPAALALEAIQERCPTVLLETELYPQLRRIGLDYGAPFQRVREVWCSAGESLSRIAVRPAEGSAPAEILPLLLDASLHSYPLLVGPLGTKATAEPTAKATADGSADPEGDIHLPTGLARCRLHRPDDPLEGTEIWSHMVLRPVDPEAVSRHLDIRLYGGDFQPLATLEGLVLNRVARQSVQAEEERILRGWLYRLGWQPAPAPAAPAPPTEAPGAWLLLADADGVVEGLAAELESRGHHCHRWRPGAPPDAVDPDRPERYAERLAALAAGESLPFRGVVHGWGLDIREPDDDGATETLLQAESLGLKSLLFLTQAVRAEEAFRGARQWVLTRHAQAVEDPATTALPPIACAQASLWGMARSLAHEYPAVWGGAIDLAPLPAPRGNPPPLEEARQLAAELLHPTGEPQIALRGAARFVARLLPWEPERGAVPRPLRTDGSYLITGGLGMIGLRTAHWLVAEHGVRRLVLTGRSGANAAARKAVKALEALGATVRVVAADVAVEADVERLLRQIDGPLRGIVHGAGVLRDGIVAQQDWEHFRGALAPKIHGAWLLHHHTRNHDLDLFLLHSSLLSWTGAVGQANYTAANAFLDALVDRRRAQGLAASAIQWGPWAEAGLATAAGEKGEDLWRRLGVRFIAPANGVQALAFLHRQGASHGAFTLTDWPRLGAAQPSSAVLLRELLAAHPPRSEGIGATVPEGGTVPAAGPEDWRGRLRDAAPGERRAVLRRALCWEIAAELGFPEPVPSHSPLSDLGLDSLIAVNVANRLETQLGLPVPLVLLVRGPSVDELMERLTTDSAIDWLRDLPAEAPGAESGARGTPLTASAAAAASVASAAAAATAASAAAATTGRGTSSQRSAGGWLVFPKPNPAARVRLVCFPYAGAGAPVFQPWASHLDPAIELVAVEAPGRAGRVEEPPVSTLQEYMAGLLPDLEPYLDKPCALFGHCQGAINLHEVARALRAAGQGDLVHLFVSGARPPHRLFDLGPFEEMLAAELLKLPGYDPIVPLHHQKDDVFAAALLHFDIGATAQFLANPELRRLLLPAVRADFATLADYRASRDAPASLPITCIAGLEDPYVSRRDAIEWSEYTDSLFKIHFLASAHYLIIEEREAILDVINHDLTRRLPTIPGASNRPATTPQPVVVDAVGGG